jgi:hypothetical protein
MPSRAAFCVRALLRVALEDLRGRREGRVSTDTHGPRATKKHAAVTTGSAATGIPCAMVLRLIRDLPGNGAFLLPSPARPLVEQLSANLASASGGQDHTTSPSALVRLVLHHPRVQHPASTSVTVATPLCNEAGRAAVDNDFQKLARLFFAHKLERGDPIETARRMSFLRMSFRPR